MTDEVDFPQCEHLLRDNWFLAVPLDVAMMHAGLREQEQIEPERLIDVSQQRFVRRL